MKIIQKLSGKISPKAFGRFGRFAKNLGSKATTLGSRGNVEISTLTVSRKTYPGVAGAISITSGSGDYRINGGSWVSSAGTLIISDYIEARTTSSGSYDTAVALVFDIDGSADTFTVTTRVEVGYALDPDGNNMIDPDGNLVGEF